MRIISGLLGGRNFDSPRGHKTHPMSEKIRGAIFNSLGDIEGLRILDAFAGSGAISFEAVSRGAKEAVAIDSSKDAIDAIQRSIRDLNLEGKVKAIQANVASWGDNNQTKQFDIVFADPPYQDTQERILNMLSIHLSPNGLYVLSLPPDCSFSPKSMELLKEKVYGDSTVRIYKNIVK